MVSAALPTSKVVNESVTQSHTSIMNFEGYSRIQYIWMYHICRTVWPPKCQSCKGVVYKIKMPIVHSRASQNRIFSEFLLTTSVL